MMEIRYQYTCMEKIMEQEQATGSTQKIDLDWTEQSVYKERMNDTDRHHRISELQAKILYNQMVTSLLCHKREEITLNKSVLCQE